MEKQSEIISFNKAKDTFFGMSPVYPYWIFTLLFRAVKLHLEMRDNYDINSSDVVACLTINDLEVTAGTEKTISEWQQKGIINKCVICTEKGSNEIESLLEAVQKEDKIRQNSGRSFLGFDQWDNLFLFPVAETFMNLAESGWLKDNASMAFESLLFDIQNRYGRSLSVERYYQQINLTKLVVGLLDVHEGEVFNPFADTCYYGAQLDSNITYYAKNGNLLGQLYMVLCDRGNALDNIDHLLSNKDNVDYMVSTIPFLASFNALLLLYAHQTRKKAVLVCNAGICMDRLISSVLLDKDYIESIILLPEKMFSTTSIETAIFVINKDKSNKGIIRFVDAIKSFVVSENERLILTEQVLEKVNNTEPLDGVADININTIKNNILYPIFYTYQLPSEPKGFKYIKLSDCIKKQKHKTILPIGPIKYLTSKSFSYKKLDNRIVNIDKLNISEKFHDKHVTICDDTLFINLKAPSKSTVIKIDKDSEDSIVSFDLKEFMAFDINTDIVDPQYLLYELHSEHFKEQLKRFGPGLYNMAINPELFTELYILLPKDKVTQSRVISRIYEEDIAKKGIETEAYRKSLYDSFMFNQRQRKHAAAQVLNGLAPAFDVVKNFIFKNKEVSIDSVVSQFNGKTLGQYLESIQGQIEKMESLIDRFTETIEFNEPEDLEIGPFLTQYAERQDRNNLEFQVTYNHNYEVEEIEPSVMISPKDLTQALDNLISNAKKHGFTDIKRRDYEIRIETVPLHSYSDPVQIKISNNGNLVSDSIKKEKLFTWGVGRGTGIGCWQVKDIIEHFKGKVYYNEYPDAKDGFCCEFTIELPLSE